MPYESGGRSEKQGNRYESKWTIMQLLGLIEEQIREVIIEPIGDLEKGIDLWVLSKEGIWEGQQCKGRNASAESWTIKQLISKGILKNWRTHLMRDPNCHVSLVSPLSFIRLVDVSERAKNTNGLPLDFYNYQIKKSGEEVRNFFRDFCLGMQLDSNREDDLRIAMDFLSRIDYRQYADSTIEEFILEKIRLLFQTDADTVYASLQAYVMTQDVWGKEITSLMLIKYFEENNCVFRDLARDPRVLPRITALNREYENAFNPINNHIIDRSVVTSIMTEINDGKSVIIHGRAGSGKSGCTHGVINCLKEQGIPFLSIKLDTRIPEKTLEKWSEDLGLPASLVHCLHSISRTLPAVLIMDQLDALRWATSYSKDAMVVCAEAIRSVEAVNNDRKRKISIVFVCRSYDLENDTGIANLFRMPSSSFAWAQVLVDELDESTVKDIMGDAFNRLTQKAKRLFLSPQNLYIWTKLKRGTLDNEIDTSRKLINKWWEEILESAYSTNIEENNLIVARKTMVEIMEEKSRLFVYKREMTDIIPVTVLHYLNSSGFIKVSDSQVYFAHQTIIDCFIAERMLKRYDNEADVEMIIGPLPSQNLRRRYQTQLFLQYMLEENLDTFLEVSKYMLASCNIRFSYKFLVFELLGQESYRENLIQFVLDLASDENTKWHTVETTIMGNLKYVEALISIGTLEAWFNSQEMKKWVFDILGSIYPNFSDNIMDFINRHIFESKETDIDFLKCFGWRIHKDSDDLFEIRLKIYLRYPALLNLYLEYLDIIEKAPNRAVRLIECMIENNQNNNQRSKELYSNSYYGDQSYYAEHHQFVISKLLPYIPTSGGSNILWGKWRGDRFGSNSECAERIAVQMIKAANKAIILESPDEFISCFSSYMGKGYPIFDEIILDALGNMPFSHSDYCINYVTMNMTNGIVDNTSGKQDKLELTKQIIKNHAPKCSDEAYKELEKAIYYFVSPDTKVAYLHRRQHNSIKENPRVYWSYWGELQFALIPSLPKARITYKMIDLAAMLSRRDNIGICKYEQHRTSGGSISSPVSGKTLSVIKWQRIISNPRISKQDKPWKREQNWVVQSSVSQFARDFESAVSLTPCDYTTLLMQLDPDSIHEEYIDAYFRGIASITCTDVTNPQLVMSVVEKHGISNQSTRASSFCRLIKNHVDYSWSLDAFRMVSRIAIEHVDPEPDYINVTSPDDKEMKTLSLLESNAINCTRGIAANAIEQLLWKEKSLLSHFDDALSHLVEDSHAAVRLACLGALAPTFNINSDKAMNGIRRIIEYDYRVSASHSVRSLIRTVFMNDQGLIEKSLLQCFNSEDRELQEHSAKRMCEIFLLHKGFCEYFEKSFSFTMSHITGISDVLYESFDNERFTDVIKRTLLILCCNVKHLIDISQLFFSNKVNIERDNEFLLEILKFASGKRIVYSFLHYLEENSLKYSDYADIIFSFCDGYISSFHKDDEPDYDADMFMKLIFELYDECVINKKYENANRCLDLWDLMFEFQVGSVRRLSSEIMER